MSIITKRTSIRTFTESEIEPDVLTQLIEAAQAAPSSKNKQPWQFILLTHKELIEEIAAFHPNWKILSNANKAIIVCGDLQKDERETHTLMACSAATQNILLKCTELDLGAVWLGLYPDETRVNYIKQKLNLPADKLPISLIAIGHPKTTTEKNRTLDINSIQLNGWQA